MDQLEIRQLIFSGHGIIGRLFTSNPWVVAAIASSLAILCLNLPAGLLGLGHVIANDGRDVGYFAKYNWSLVYPLLVPALLALGILTFRRMHSAVYELINENDVPVIMNDKGLPAKDYPLYLSKTLATGAGWIEAVAATVALAITMIDTADLWPPFFNGGAIPISRTKEWDTAAFWYSHGHVFGHVWRNYGFDLIAYAFQTSLIFLGLVFLIKYWTFMRAMVAIIDQGKPPYRFAPLIRDTDRRLGLKPLGWVFNFFLVVIVLYQVYSFYHRIELIDANRGNESQGYLKVIWRAVKPSENTGILQQAKTLLKLPANDYAWAHLANPSSWLPLVFSLPPILVICLLPLGSLFLYLRREMQRMTKEANRALSIARSTHDDKRSNEIIADKKCLEETTIWPNGSRTGSMFLILMVGLLIGTIAPPLLLYGVASGIILKLVYSVLGKPKT